MLHARVHAADAHGRRAAEAVLDGLGQRFPTVTCLFADMAYQGLQGWLDERLGWRLLIVKRPSRWVWAPVDQPPSTMPVGFQALPKRWIVERTFAPRVSPDTRTFGDGAAACCGGWLGRQRRLAKDWERLAATNETWIYPAMSRLMEKRLARAAA